MTGNGEQLTDDQILFLLEMCCTDPERDPISPDLDDDPFKHEDFWAPERAR